ncbi:MAG: hypothetical protein HOQ22_08325 [Nocardioidaceae bacterium]|nr:hypothetical protein [Nocardioidaceae bacterium]NUS51026.1 hypothetical protein [Nocardioidaceae bacterium]
MLRRTLIVIVLTILIFVLTGCGGDGTSSSQSSPATSSRASSPTTPASSASGGGATCAALADLRTAGTQLQQDFQTNDTAALAADIRAVRSAVDELFAALEKESTANVADVKTAWQRVQPAARGLSTASPGQVAPELRTAVAAFVASLASLGTSVDCH